MAPAGVLAMTDSIARGLMSGLYLTILDVALTMMVVGLVDMRQARGR